MSVAARESERHSPSSVSGHTGLSSALGHGKTALRKNRTKRTNDLCFFFSLLFKGQKGGMQ